MRFIEYFKYFKLKLFVHIYRSFQKENEGSNKLLGRQTYIPS